LQANGLSHLAVIVGIETAAAVERASDLLHSPVTAAYFGAEDFAADMGGERTPEGLEVLYARSRVVIAARLAGVVALDQVVPDFHDDDRFIADARSGRAMGYGGKLCIHPSQPPLANSVFSPSPKEVERARQLLEAHRAAAAEGSGIIVFEGQMVDEPMVVRAETVLARASLAGDQGDNDER
jgi:citrate lyase subunit beta/citryl-CoA lyase